MTEKIIYSPDKASPGKAAPAGAQGGSPLQGRANDPGLFAEILAEAEAVQDHVEVHGPYRAGATPGPAGSSVPGVLRELMQTTLQGGIQGVAGMLSRAPQRSQPAAQEVKPPRKTG